MPRATLEVGTQRKGLILLKKLNGKQRYLCKCVYCDNEVVIIGTHFGRNRSCGCQQLKTGKDSYRYIGYEDISGTKWCGYRRNAKLRNISFEISMEDAWCQYLKQDGLCALTGDVLIISDDASFGNASLDRIDSSRGYTKDNIQWVTKKINKMKMDLSMDEFLLLCEKVNSYNHR